MTETTCYNLWSTPGVYKPTTENIKQNRIISKTPIDQENKNSAEVGNASAMGEIATACNVGHAIRVMVHEEYVKD